MSLGVEATRILEGAVGRASRAAKAPIRQVQESIKGLEKDVFLKSAAASRRIAPEVKPAPASILHFDQNIPPVQHMVHNLGWDHLPGTRVGLQADATYAKFTTDGWKTSAIAPLQYLRDGYQGFLLRGVKPGTPIEFAVQAKVGLTHNDFYSLDQTATNWLTTWGHNLEAITEKP